MIFAGIKVLTILAASIYVLLTKKKSPNVGKFVKRVEGDHTLFLRNNSAECTLFLKRDQNFPIKKPGTLLLVGSGVRNTINGGWGSADVETDFIKSAEQSLEEAGFTIVSKDWLEKYPSFKKEKHNAFLNTIKEEAHDFEANVIDYSMGQMEPEVEYKLPLDQYKADAAIYILSRRSGEGSDRRDEGGDIYLTRTEIDDLFYLRDHYEKFLLVLNVGGVIDLTPTLTLKNILLLSQLGEVTADVLADIVTGKVNPSGKLTASWSPANIYEYLVDFGNINDTLYKEGVYVGYRYFDSVEYTSPYFAFGYGKSYTDFIFKKVSLSHHKSEIKIEVHVKNVGRYEGKEVIQVYVSPSQNNENKPFQSLVAFKKTQSLKPKEHELLTLTFNLEDIARYDTNSAKYILDNGDYIIRVGNSSDNTFIYGYITLVDDIVVKEVKNLGGKKPEFKDFVPRPEVKTENVQGYQQIKLYEHDFKKIKVKYGDYKYNINSKVKDLSEKELGKICIGKHIENADKDDIKRYMPKVFGAAGETVAMRDDEKKYLTLADGPSGIRIARKYGVDDKGSYRLCNNPIADRLVDYLTKEEFSQKIDTLSNNLGRHGKEYYQNATAIPIATALAQTFNEELVEQFGNIIANDMDKFNIQILLAPGANIQRNILCGRNFEYFSEDPLLSGKMAGALIRGVQKKKNRGATIKHFACYNQELNRLNSNSVVSERALREIYLRSFEIAIKESNPVAIMTSYNLINGEHSSQRKDLLIDVIRTEWEYKGLIMTDWIKSGRTPIARSRYPSQFAQNNIIGGNNLQMPGSHYDYQLVMDAFNNGTLTKDNLLECASYVYDTIEKLTK